MCSMAVSAPHKDNSRSILTCNCRHDWGAIVRLCLAAQDKCVHYPKWIREMNHLWGNVEMYLNANSMLGKSKLGVILRRLELWISLNGEACIYYAELIHSIRSVGLLILRFYFFRILVDDVKSLLCVFFFFSSSFLGSEGCTYFPRHFQILVFLRAPGFARVHFLAASVNPAPVFFSTGPVCWTSGSLPPSPGWPTRGPTPAPTTTTAVSTAAPRATATATAIWPHTAAQVCSASTCARRKQPK